MKVLKRPALLPLVAILVVLLAIYLSTLQTIPNGAEHYFTIDVGETQIVLNTWGTLHATGYPLYVMIGNVLVTGMRLVGVSAAVAPAVTSLIYGMVALVLIYVLAVHITDHYWLAAGMVLLFGLTRTVWIHHAIAEIYTFGLLILALLLVVALWQRPIRGRVYWLAFIGGIGVFQHRALLMVAPALVYAAWGELFSSNSLERGTRYKAVRTFVFSLLLGLIGFVPYLYLPLRAQAGAHWVYGQPGTWNGFWDQFLGREASRFIGAPATLDGLVANFNLINTVLVTDLTVPGVVLGLAGLLLGLRNPLRRKLALTMLLSGGVAYVFHVLLYTDILSALILPMTLALAFGWLLLAEWIIQVEPQSHREASHRRRGHGDRRESLFNRLYWLPLSGVVVLGVVVFINQNWGFIHDLTSNRTGLETIELAKGTPSGSTLMLDWGPRHFAVGFARDVLGELPDVTLVDHKADLRSLIEQGKLVTADFTFYNRPLAWWEQQLGQAVYLSAAAPHLVQIAAQPLLSAEGGTGLRQYQAALTCSDTALVLDVDWFTPTVPEYDLSVFVHLLDSSGTIIAQADQSAPVYGWRPLTTWTAGEVVRDIYPLPRLPDSTTIQYGLYHQLASGEFVNDYEYDMPVKCDG
ncbi:MAG: DUF2723 domain-containing protein [Anaerolineae bacterium]